MEQLKALVCNVMSTPAITLSAEKTVSGKTLWTGLSGFLLRELLGCWVKKNSENFEMDF
jgi:hypothetical protein